MSEKEKKVADTLAKAFAVLPEGKKEYLLGYAEGVTVMADKEADNARTSADSLPPTTNAS